MHVQLHDSLASDARATQARDLISACVHCGFCLATCPTYLDGGDERDSPRGRIYLIKQLLEEGEATAITRTHLDRCLTCRSCETTCPSGMQYGSMLDLGRGLIEEQAPRSRGERTARALLRNVLSRPRLFTPLLRAGQLLRPILPAALRAKVPLRRTAGPLPAAQHERKMLILGGCAQQAATPDTNGAIARVLSRLGISVAEANGAQCCGAVNYHLGAHEAGLDNMRKNIDAWWPHIENGTQAIISSATGCGSMVADYAKLLAHDPNYAAKAAAVSRLHRDIAQVLLAEDLSSLSPAHDRGTIAVHIPCSQQHALKQPETVRHILAEAGFQLASTREDHLCCGSAGTYSVLQPLRSGRLRKRKLDALTGAQPALIATANVGCQLHLAEESDIPVCHWITLLDAPEKA
jgi:glycolate dehydrogenase iron-sulfur subunit